MCRADCFGSEKPKLPQDKPAGFMVVAEAHGVADWLKNLSEISTRT
jgi:hypothetical protein